MAESTTTLRQIFSIPADDDQNKAPDGWKTFQEALSKDLKTIKGVVSISELASKIGGLFDIKLPDLLVGFWKKAEDLQSVLAESRREPEELRYLDLADHSISSEHHPYLDLKVRNASLKRIEFAIKLQFTLQGFVLQIQDGRITHVKTGQCEVGGTVEYEGLTILKREAAPIDLPESLTLSFSTSGRQEEE